VSAPFCLSTSTFFVAVVVAIHHYLSVSVAWGPVPDPGYHPGLPRTGLASLGEAPTVWPWRGTLLEPSIRRSAPSRPDEGRGDGLLLEMSISEKLSRPLARRSTAALPGNMFQLDGRRARLTLAPSLWLLAPVREALPREHLPARCPPTAARGPRWGPGVLPSFRAWTSRGRWSHHCTRLR